jgi:glycosyltransferase involved in cell wall biosynthesis
MIAPPAPTGKRILMTVDALGGVWRYAMDLARASKPFGYEFVFACLGPPPDAAKWQEAESIGTIVTCDAPLDWITQDETELNRIPEILTDLVNAHSIDLLHLNLPSQAANLQSDIPVLVVSHSCVVTWFAAVRRSGVPSDWHWQERRNRLGLENADLVIAPSRSHAALLEQCYGEQPELAVVYNGSDPIGASREKDALAFAAGRWWDEGKNGAVLDRAAALTATPIQMAGSQNGPNGQYVPLDHAKALGSLPFAQVVELMNRAAVFVSPSIYEPFGLAPLEAAHAGAALVLSDIPTYRELWDGAALFAAPEDPAAFADAVDRLAADAELRQELASRGRYRAEQYSLSAQADRMNRLYQDLLASPPLTLEA